MSVYVASNYSFAMMNISPIRKAEQLTKLTAVSVCVASNCMFEGFLHKLVVEEDKGFDDEWLTCYGSTDASWCLVSGEIVELTATHEARPLPPPLGALLRSTRCYNSLSEY